MDKLIEELNDEAVKIKGSFSFGFSVDEKKASEVKASLEEPKSKAKESADKKDSQLIMGAAFPPSKDTV